MYDQQLLDIGLLERSIMPKGIAAIPKADLHQHSEVGSRLQRLLAEGKGEAAYDWRSWAARLVRDVPRGVARLENWDFQNMGAIVEKEDGRNFRALIVDGLEEAASSGAIYAEVRFGRFLRPDFISLFREAESEVQQRHPGFFAEPIACLFLPQGSRESGEQINAAVALRHQGLAGVDLIPTPYDQEADWFDAYGWTEKLSDAGLGVTIHAGEFSTANLESALRAPGVNRIGHGVHAATDQKFIDLALESGVAIEVCLTANLILGGVELEGHPISRFIEAGIPISLNTDNPVHFQSNIGREYEIAHRIGLSEDTLRDLTRTAILHSFTTPSRREQLLESI